MRTVKLTKEEKKIEDALIGGEYKPVSKKEFNAVLKAINARKKDGC